jgi:hypothetical protein
MFGLPRRALAPCALRIAPFAEIAGRIIDRAVTAGRLRGDFTVADFHQLACGVISSMYFSRGGRSDWRRHLDLALNGIRAPVR